MQGLLKVVLLPAGADEANVPSGSFAVLHEPRTALLCTRFGAAEPPRTPRPAQTLEELEVFRGGARAAPSRPRPRKSSPAGSAAGGYLAVPLRTAAEQLIATSCGRTVWFPSTPDRGNPIFRISGNHWFPLDFHSNSLFSTENPCWSIAVCICGTISSPFVFKSSVPTAWRGIR